MFTHAVLAFASFACGVLALCGSISAFILLLMLFMVLPFRLLRKFRQRRIEAAADGTVEDLLKADPLPGEYGFDPEFPTRPHYPNGMKYRDPNDADVQSDLP